MTTTDRIYEFLIRYDACMFKGGTPPPVWLAEAAALLREVALPQIQDENLMPPDIAFTWEDIYQSANGDRWRLMRDMSTRLAFVYHYANPSSGGQITEMLAEEFLARENGSPEYVALRHMLALPNKGL